MPHEPSDASSTVRARLREELERGPASARDLSAAVGIREKDVPGHLEHLARSLEAQGRRLAIEPSHCLACGYLFEGRKRLSKPSRCPRCRSERLEPPLFAIAPAG